MHPIGFNSRSDEMREAIRSFVDEAEWESLDCENQLVITAIYSEHGPGGSCQCYSTGMRR
jgi:metal-responsive CopG/Arc/MetJ family transcriptional regulator